LLKWMTNSHTIVVKVNPNCIANGFTKEHKHNEQIKENEMGCKCSINERDHKGIKLQVGKPKGKETHWKTDALKKYDNIKPDLIKSS